MTRDGAVPWSEDQWAAIEGLVQDAARRTRLAASFLPMTGPLPPGQSYVVASELKLTGQSQSESRSGEGEGQSESETRSGEREGQSQSRPLQHVLDRGWTAGSPRQSIYVAEAKTLPLARLSVPVYLTSSEVADPHLASAGQIFARAAGIIGRLEDAVVFNGLWRNPHNPDDVRYRDKRGIDWKPEIYVVHAPDEPIDGLLVISAKTDSGFAPAPTIDLHPPFDAESLVNAVSESVSELEDLGYDRPFACVLGNELYRIGQHVRLADASAGDRIEPYLGGGPFLRSSMLPDAEGVVIALGGETLDLVIGSDLAVNFLQITPEPHYIFSLSETMRLRVKDHTGGVPWRRILKPEEPAGTDLEPNS